VTFTHENLEKLSAFSRQLSALPRRQGRRYVAHGAGQMKKSG
jgi:hypothetical protein